MDFNEFRERINSWYAEVLPNIEHDDEKSKIPQAVENAKTMRLNANDIRVLKEHGLYHSLTQLFKGFSPFGIRVDAQCDTEFESVYFEVNEKVRSLLIERVKDKDNLKTMLSGNLKSIPDGNYIATPVSVHTYEEIFDCIPFEVENDDVIVD